MQNKKRHPKGLYVLFLTEMWERFSYYGMRAMFVLYMVKCLMMSEQDASQIYGSYTGLVYLTPLLGGYIADRYWGNRRSVLLGSVVMALGQFLMFVSACYYTHPSAHYIMFAGLGLLILGNGFFKPNISSMVGDLYERTDSLRDSAYTIFYMGVNVGAMIAPLWCGFVSNNESPEGFKWSFLSAAVGMLIAGVIFFCYKNKYLRDPEGNPIGTKPSQTETSQQTATGMSKGFKAMMLLLFAALFVLFHLGGNDLIGSAIYSVSITVPVMIITDKSLTTLERKRIGVIYAITFFVIFFWAAFEQCVADILRRQADRPRNSRMDHAGFLLPVVQSDSDCSARSGFQPAVAFSWQQRARTGCDHETSHRPSDAWSRLSGHRLRSGQRERDNQSEHDVARRALLHAHHRRALPRTYRPVHRQPPFAGQVFLPADGRVVSQLGSGQ